MRLTEETPNETPAVSLSSPQTSVRKHVKRRRAAQERRQRNRTRESGLPFLQSLHVYHALFTMPWWKFNLLLVATFVVARAERQRCPQQFSDHRHNPSTSC